MPSEAEQISLGFTATSKVDAGIGRGVKGAAVEVPTGSDALWHHSARVSGDLTSLASRCLVSSAYPD